MKGALARLGIRGSNPKLRNASEQLANLLIPEGQPVPPNALAELQRDLARLRFIAEQVKQIEVIYHSCCGPAGAFSAVQHRCALGGQSAEVRACAGAHRGIAVFAPV